MSSTKYILRSISGIALGSVATLVVFGLSLALLWAVFPAMPSLKLSGALISAALALIAGGFVLAWLSGGSNLLRSAMFGLLFGGVSFTYILGLDWNALVLGGASALFAFFGALVFKWAVRNGLTCSGVTK